MRKPLTPRQQEIYDFLVEEILTRGIPPTIREIADRFDMSSSNGAREALNVLVHKGYINRRDRLSRSIELIQPIESSSATADRVHEQQLSGQRVPIIAHVPSGSTDIAAVESSGHIIVDGSLIPPQGMPFATVVPNSSMHSSDILRGDTVIAVAQSVFEDKDLVVAVVDTMPIVCRYNESPNGVVLTTDQGIPAALISGESSRMAVVGKVCGLVRSFVGNQPES
jgi:repressor LexA